MILPSLEPKATKSFDHPTQLLLFEFQWKRGKVMSFIMIPPSLSQRLLKSVDQVTHLLFLELQEKEEERESKLLTR
jgi:hypothetical protein